jgi:hypothetical protein
MLYTAYYYRYCCSRAGFSASNWVVVVSKSSNTKILSPHSNSVAVLKPQHAYGSQELLATENGVVCQKSRNPIQCHTNMHDCFSLPAHPPPDRFFEVANGGPVGKNSASATRKLGPNREKGEGQAHFLSLLLNILEMAGWQSQKYSSPRKTFFFAS